MDAVSSLTEFATDAGTSQPDVVREAGLGQVARRFSHYASMSLSSGYGFQITSKEWDIFMACPRTLLESSSTTRPPLYRT